MSSPMNTWILEPRDTIVVRDGRPLQETGTMRSVDFPWPSTIAGTVRTRAGTDASGHFGMQLEDARKIAVRGPLLVELDESGAVIEYLFPAPRDQVLLRHDDGTTRRRRLVSRALANGEMTDLSLSGVTQLPDFPSAVTKAKPVAGPPFWRWSEIEAWLTAPTDDEPTGPGFGQSELLHEVRTHVAVAFDSQTASDGQLYSTDALRFTTQRRSRLAISFQTAAALGPGAVLAGGERRPSSLVQAKGGAWPVYPSAMVFGAERIARVVLLTPGIFDAGAIPRSFGADVELVSCCVPRAEVISGWSFEKGKEGPKGTRRMVPAGSVYWVKLGASVNADAWARSMWMSCIADQAQDRLDGFGLVIVGVG